MTATRVQMQKRPKEFDARVMAYLPGLTNRAKRYRHRSEDQADLVTDTIIYALGSWETFREDGSLWGWLCFCMRGVVSNQARKAATRKGLRFVELTGAADAVHSTKPSQHHHVELAETLALMPRIRGGDVALRRAMGDTLREIGAPKGIGTTRVDQIVNKARAQLQAAA
ncbi:MAG: sigma-70 family RNA polymerase sigma factor [Mesorhizobium sp.]|nr:MAG: sigma-70 family RNA polymerase sigma factor [Mesorhizobium sp.]